MNTTRRVLTLLTMCTLTACGDEKGPGVTVPDLPTFSCAAAGDTPGVMTATLDFREVRLDWTASTKATFRLESHDRGGNEVILDDIPGTQCSAVIQLPPLHEMDWASTRYQLSACDAAGACEMKAEFAFEQSHSAAATGYFQATFPGVGDKFGHAIDLSEDGDTLVAGAPFADNGSAESGAEDSGIVYVFTREDDEWTTEEIVPPDSEAGSRFGFAVAVSGDAQVLAVGAPGSGSGSASVYRHENGAWTFKSHVSGNPVADNEFGRAIALTEDGTGMLVGAPGEGKAYWFELQDGEWVEVAQIEPASKPLRFGEHVAVDARGSHLAIGAPNAAGCESGIDPEPIAGCPHAGAVYVFSRDAGGIRQQAYLKPPANVAANQHFGRRLALSGDGRALAVGMPYTDASSSGRVHVYVLDEAAWMHQTMLVATNAEPLDGFGAAMALSHDGTQLVVGAVGEQGTAVGVNGDQDSKNPSRGVGGAWLFKSESGIWSDSAYLKPASDGAGGFGGAVAISADGQRIFVAAEHDSGTGASPEDTHGRHRSGAVFGY